MLQVKLLLEKTMKCAFDFFCFITSYTLRMYACRYASMYACIHIFLYVICIIIRDNVTYEGFRVLNYL